MWLFLGLLKKNVIFLFDKIFLPEVSLDSRCFWSVSPGMKELSPFWSSLTFVRCFSIPWLFNSPPSIDPAPLATLCPTPCIAFCPSHHLNLKSPGISPVSLGFMGRFLVHLLIWVCFLTNPPPFPLAREALRGSHLWLIFFSYLLALWFRGQSPCWPLPSGALSKAESTHTRALKKKVASASKSWGTHHYCLWL